jgi:hypothetical protein
MRIFHGQPAGGKPRKIACAGCGKRAVEAGFAVPDEAVEEDDGPNGPKVALVHMGDTQPLCESCVTSLLRGDDGVV